MLQSNVTVPKILEEQEFGVIWISPSIFQLSLSFLENKEFKSVWTPQGGSQTIVNINVKNEEH